MKLSNFWDGKTPCWVILNCSKYVYKVVQPILIQKAPAGRKLTHKCEILLGIKKDCKSCKIFKLYSGSKTDLHSEISSMKDSS